MSDLTIPGHENGPSFEAALSDALGHLLFEEMKKPGALSMTVSVIRLFGLHRGMEILGLAERQALAAAPGATIQEIKAVCERHGFTMQSAPTGRPSGSLCGQNRPKGGFLPGSNPAKGIIRNS